MKRFSKTVVVILVILIFITALWAWKGELLPGGLPRFLPQKETAEETESLTASEESVNSTESPTEETVPAALQEESGTEQEGQGTPFCFTGNRLCVWAAGGRRTAALPGDAAGNNRLWTGC